jgi:hypothetical protein
MEELIESDTRFEMHCCFLLFELARGSGCTRIAKIE